MEGDSRFAPCNQVAYLNKVISAVSEAVGEVKVKSSKIVAGMEPENTNALLQGLAKAASGGNAKAAPPPEEKKTAPPPPAVS